jgi:hypothetical protein
LQTTKQHRWHYEKSNRNEQGLNLIWLKTFLNLIFIYPAPLWCDLYLAAGFFKPKADLVYVFLQSRRHGLHIFTE